MTKTFKDTLAEHTAMAQRLSKLTGSKRTVAIDELVKLEDTLFRQGEQAYDFAHRALFRGYTAKLADLIDEKRYAEATSIAKKLVQGERLPWALQYSRDDATRVIKQMLRAYYVDDAHSARAYENTFRDVRSYVADLYHFMNFEIAAFECEHGDIERGLAALAALSKEELKGVYTHRAFARLKDNDNFLQILESKGVLPKAVLAERKKPPPVAAPRGAITEDDLRVLIKRKRKTFSFVYWPSGHLKSATTEHGTLRLDEEPGSGSVSLHRGFASLSESYSGGMARWSIGTAWNDSDDGGQERIKFSAWVEKWLKEIGR